MDKKMETTMFIQIGQGLNGSRAQGLGLLNWCGPFLDALGKTSRPSPTSNATPGDYNEQ